MKIPPRKKRSQKRDNQVDEDNHSESSGSELEEDDESSASSSEESVVEPEADIREELDDLLADADQGSAVKKVIFTSRKAKDGTQEGKGRYELKEVGETAPNAGEPMSSSSSLSDDSSSGSLSSDSDSEETDTSSSEDDIVAGNTEAPQTNAIASKSDSDMSSSDALQENPSMTSISISSSSDNYQKQPDALTGPKQTDQANGVPPGKGKLTTKKRNQRRRLANKAFYQARSSSNEAQAVSRDQVEDAASNSHINDMPKLPVDDEEPRHPDESKELSPQAGEIRSAKRDPELEAAKARLLNMLDEVATQENDVNKVGKQGMSSLLTS